MSDNIKTRVERILSIGEETIGGENLENLLLHKPIVKAYDGFEPSGRIHIAQGLIRTINVNKITKSGVKFVFLVADYFALLNLKMNGKMDRINKAGELMIHTWKACGMDMSNVEFVWASDEIQKRSAEYWSLVFDISTKVNVKRTLKCTQILGRKDFTDDDNNTIPYDEMLSSMKTSQIFYPIMQTADIFFLGIDICSLGKDQRKVNMLALEYCDMIKRKFKPIILSHHMLSGLDGSDKMAKSNPNSAIFMDDSDQDINMKIKKAFCEPGNIAKNPILEYFKYIVFEKEDNVIIEIYNPETQQIKEKSYTNYQDLELDYANQIVYPSDLKKGLSRYLKKYLDPVREYFANNPEAEKLRKDVKNLTS
jgi:tyrosyl-tRNA synthetase